MVVGTCGNCGGPVMVPDLWGGIIPPTPTCANCNSTAKAGFGEVLPMEKPKPPLAPEFK